MAPRKSDKSSKKPNKRLQPSRSVKVVRSPRSNVKFSDLPAEMKSKIFSELDLETKKSGRLVNRECKTLVEDQLKFNVILSDSTYETVKEIDPNLAISSLTVANFNTNLPNTSFTRCGLPKNVKEIKLGTGIGFPGDSRRCHNPPYTVLRTSPILEDYDFNNNGISGKNVQAVLSCNPGLESLIVTGLAFKTQNIRKFPDFSLIKLEYLTKLDVNYGHYPFIQSMPKYSEEPVIALLQNKYPSLKTLKYSSTAFKAEMKLFVALLQCIGNHSRTLKNVDIFHSTVYSLPHRNETGTWFNSRKYDELKEKLEQVSLEYLSIDLMRCGPNAGARWKELESVFMKSQTNLRTLRIMLNGRATRDWEMEPILRASGNTLMTLELYFGCFCDTYFDFVLLKNCSQLRTLNVQIIRTFYGLLLGQRHIPRLFRSVEELPQTITYLRLSHILQENDVEWVSRNLINLEEVVFAYVNGPTEEDTLLRLFKCFLMLPKLRRFHLRSVRSERIILFSEVVPGLTNCSTGTETHIKMNRQICHQILPNFSN